MITIIFCLIILTTSILFAVQFYKSINTTLRTKTEGHSDAELWALSWFYWLEEMHTSGVSVDRQVTCFAHAGEARTALMRELGETDWFTPEPGKAKTSTQASAQQQEAELPEGVSSLEEHRQMKEYKESLKHDYWDY
jgi:hypothetical protein